MKRFFIIANIDKDKSLIYATQIKNYLREHDCECVISQMENKSVGNGLKNEIMIPDGMECVIVLGGDGTLIQAAGLIASHNIPLIGVNLGKLGYLAEVEKESIIPMLKRLIKDDYEIEERMMLSGVIVKSEERGTTGNALNDIIIARSGDLRVVVYNIYVNGKHLNTYEADGIIVSTPTGSTGYNLSAGGPIIEPDAKVILVTPICPHTLNSRAIVLSPEDEVRVEIGKGRMGEEQALVSFDGLNGCQMVSSDYVDIKKADEVTRIIKMRKESFLDILSRKMTEVM